MIKWMRRHPILIFIFLLLVGVAGAAVHKSRQVKLMEVDTRAVERIDELNEVVTASGEIRAHEEVDIQTEIAGVIIEVPVVEGQRVEKGDILLKIDDFQAQRDRISSRAQYASAVADVERTRSMIATAQANLMADHRNLKTSELALEEARISSQRANAQMERQRRLREDGAVSADAFESVESEALLAAKRVESAEARIEQIQAQITASEAQIRQQEASLEATQQNVLAAQAALERQADMLAKLTILSPLDGIITRLNVSVGERAVPGIQSNPQATLMTIANLAHVEAELKVDETDIVNVVLGQATIVKVDALPEQDLEAEVSEISMAPIQTASTQEGKEFKVVARLLDPPESLRMGMSCEAEITVKERENVLAIPIQAITLREVEVDADGAYVAPPKPEPGQEPKGDSASPTSNLSGSASERARKRDMTGVFVLDADGHARFRPVETGAMGEMLIEIVTGLEEGELVITGPLSAQRQLEEWKLLRKREVTGQ